MPACPSISSEACKGACIMPWCPHAGLNHVDALMLQWGLQVAVRKIPLCLWAEPVYAQPTAHASLTAC